MYSTKYLRTNSCSNNKFKILISIKVCIDVLFETNILNSII